MYTIDHIKSAFNAGKHFNTYEDWVNWSNDQINKVKTSDPYVIMDKLINIGGQLKEKISDYHIDVDLYKSSKDEIYKLLKIELFERRGYGSSVGSYKYISPKYNKMSLDFDSTIGYIRIFHQDPISKEEFIRIKTINGYFD